MDIRWHIVLISMEFPLVQSRDFLVESSRFIDGLPPRCIFAPSLRPPHGRFKYTDMYLCLCLCLAFHLSCIPSSCTYPLPVASRLMAPHRRPHGRPRRCFPFSHCCNVQTVLIPFNDAVPMICLDVDQSLMKVILFHLYNCRYHVFIIGYA